MKPVPPVTSAHEVNGGLSRVISSTGAGALDSSPSLPVGAGPGLWLGLREPPDVVLRRGMIEPSLADNFVLSALRYIDYGARVRVCCAARGAEI